MLDIQLIRNDPDGVKRRLATTGTGADLIDRVLELDTRRRELQREGDALRSEANSASKGIGAEKDPEKRSALIADMKATKARIKENESASPQVERELDEIMLSIPNLPLDEVPIGSSDEQNEIVEALGKKPEFDFKPRPHWEIMSDLGIIDFERGQKVSGSRFYILKGDGSRLQRALITWMLDVHTTEHGYTEVTPPYMVRSDCLYGTGNLPKFGDHLYRDAEEDYWWIPTAEVPVTNMYREEILGREQLPIRHVAYTPCFRREKMSHGKDTRGIKRGHQFDKVEMVQFVHPDTSREALDQLSGHAAKILELLGLQYRVVKMCTGDLSFVSCLKFDLDSFAPGCDEWLEVSSCSLFGDFQARRARIRFKDTDGKNRFIHTLNGSGLALPRVIISLIETYQQKDGSVLIPEVLRPYMGGQERLTP